jgi:hypothetical protein
MSECIIELSERSKAKLDTLKYVSGLSAESLEKMKDIRAGFFKLAAEVLALGDSRETSEAFTCLETGLMFAIKHVCLVDAGALKEGIKGCCEGTECESSFNPDLPEGEVEG